MSSCRYQQNNGDDGQPCDEQRGRHLGERIADPAVDADRTDHEADEAGGGGHPDRPDDQAQEQSAQAASSVRPMR
jgi:hypothetical protein